MSDAIFFLRIILVHGVLILIRNLAHDLKTMQCVIIIYYVTIIISWSISKLSRLVK